MNFKQVVNDTTRPISGTCLDHIYSNFSQRLSSIWIQNIGLADHLPLFVARKYREKILLLIETWNTSTIRILNQLFEKPHGTQH